jgi:spermidine synthase
MSAVKKLRYFERIRPFTEIVYTIREVLSRTRTPYQFVEIFDLEEIGRALFLDGWIQIAEIDEFIYHEALVHPALLAHPNPEVVFIAGGGDGGALREILKHPTIKKVMVGELDQEVIGLSRRYLSNIHEDAWEDPRVEILIGDARHTLKGFPRTFDAVIVDLTEPVEEGPSQLLFTREFYGIVERSLRSPGVFSSQCADAGPGFGKLIADVLETLRQLTPYVRSFLAPVPSFQGLWSFAIAGFGLDPLRSSEEWKERLSLLSKPLKWCSPGILSAGFEVPPYLREILAQGKVRTDDQPYIWSL